MDSWIDDILEIFLVSKHVVSIDVLPNEVLLEVFDFYLSREHEPHWKEPRWQAETFRYYGYDEDEAWDSEEEEKLSNAPEHWLLQEQKHRDQFDKEATETWRSLIHVCRRWRCIVFEARLRLRLKLVCTPDTPTRSKLNVWPNNLPLSVRCSSAYLFRDEALDNIVAALERNDRVVEIIILWAERIYYKDHLGRFLKPMQNLFPMLKRLVFTNGTFNLEPPILPDLFLGESAQNVASLSPSLETLELDVFMLLALRNRILHFTHITQLIIQDRAMRIGIQPEEMLTILSHLICLKELWLRLRHVESEDEPDSRHSRTRTHPQAVLPALTSFHFEGTTKYLEELLVDIDSPQLSSLRTTFHLYTKNCESDVVCFIREFTDRTSTLQALETASVVVEKGFISAKFWNAPPLTGELRYPMTYPISRESLPSHFTSGFMSGHAPFDLDPELDELNLDGACYEAFYLPQVGDHSSDGLQDDAAIGDTLWALWLRLLFVFSGVKNIYLSKEFGPHIVPILQDLVQKGKRLSPLNISLEGLEPSGPIHKAIAHFMAQQPKSPDSGCDITVTHPPFPLRPPLLSNPNRATGPATAHALSPFPPRH